MVNTFAKAAKLKNWLACPDCPEPIRECKTIFDKAFPSTKPADTDPDEIATSAFVSTPSELKHLLSDRKVALRARHKVDNVVYSRSSTHMGNSLVMFYPKGQWSAEPVPGSIQYVIHKQDGSVVYAVCEQLPAPQGSVDPFRHYPDFPARIYSTGLSSKLCLVSPQWVLCHYGRWHLDDKRTVVLTLSRVCSYLTCNIIT